MCAIVEDELGELAGFAAGTRLIRALPSAVLARGDVGSTPRHLATWRVV
jgi:hypothetical protein